MSIVKVLVVANSPVTRENICGMLDSDPEIQVAGFADSADNTREKTAALNPDVVIMRLSSRSVDFLKVVLPQLTVPAVVVTDTSAEALNAVKTGWVDFVKMPLIKTSSTMNKYAQHLAQQIKEASKKKSLTPPPPVKAPSAEPAPKAAEPAPKPKAEPPVVKKAEPPAVEAPKKEPSEQADSTSKAIAAAAAAKQKLGYASPRGKRHVIALGASTGGTDALQTVLQDLPADTPGIVIVQHMPEVFTKMYADRLDRVCKMTCVEAVDGDRVEVGKIIIAAGNYHLRLAKDAKGYYVTSQHGEKVSGHCPSVDVLFESVAKVAGSDAVGAIFTGMGADGAAGLKKMREAGAFTIGQDQKSCVVYGMPMVAYNIGAVCRQAPLDNIAQIILENC